jgi:hypothetical protein
MPGTAPDDRPIQLTLVREPGESAAEFLARRAASHLTGDHIAATGEPAPGVMLVGPETRTALVIRLLLDRLDPALLQPVTIDARSATPESLRDAVAARHAARPTRETGLLLVVPDAGRLSGAVRHELELAAAAARAHGGLTILLAHTEALGPSFRDSGLPELGDCVSTVLTIAPTATHGDVRPPPLADPARGAAPGSSSGAAPGASLRSLPAALPGRAARNPTLLVVLAITVLAVLFLVIWLMLRNLGTAPVPAPVLAPVLAPVPSVPTPSASVPSITTVPRSPAPGAAPDAPPPVTQPPAPVQMPVPIPIPGPGPKPSPAPPPVPVQESGASLLLVAQPGDTLPVLYAKIYAGAEPPPFAQVQALNPIVRPGVRLVFPAPPGGWPKQESPAPTR